MNNINILNYYFTFYKICSTNEKAALTVYLHKMYVFVDWQCDLRYN